MKVRIKKHTWQTLVRGAFEFLLAVLAYVPWKPALAWGEWMGSIGYRVSARYRRVADKNLRLAYGDSLSNADREALILKMFRNFARMSLVEFLKASYLTPENLARLVRVDSFAPIDDLLARGKGLILVSAHLGNWELLARRAGREGRQVLVVARQSDDAEFNKLTDKLREHGGYTVHPRGESPRALLRQLRGNGIIAILCDQKSDDVFVPFFGHAAGTVAGPAILALKTGAPILPIFCPRQPDGTYRMETLPEIDTTRTKNATADAQRIMTDVTAAIETMVRRYPDQWLWMHDRWRMPPDWKKSRKAEPVEARGPE
ncbi:MAG: lysophospholipid acyltransferase family protein [Armatimonadota bacterium]|nr:lysophospholipid acyltransferase family protein [Armatimonadota bacterium]